MSSGVRASGRDGGGLLDDFAVLIRAAELARVGVREGAVGGGPLGEVRAEVVTALRYGEIRGPADIARAANLLRRGTTVALERIRTGRPTKSHRPDVVGTEGPSAVPRPDLPDRATPHVREQSRRLTPHVMSSALPAVAPPSLRGPASDPPAWLEPSPAVPPPEVAIGATPADASGGAPAVLSPLPPVASGAEGGLTTLPEVRRSRLESLLEHPPQFPLWLGVVADGVKAVGVVLIVSVLWALYGTALLQGWAQRTAGSSHAVLAAPVIGLNEALFSGDGASALRNGPGITSTPAVTMVVGHRVTEGAPFRYLSTLKAGNAVTLRRFGTTETFIVERIVSVRPGAAISEPAGGGLLLLVTDDPPYQQSRELVVIARQSGTTVVGALTVHLPALRGSALDLVVAVCVLLLIGAGWGLRQGWSPFASRWLSIATWVPILLAAALFTHLLLGSMSRLL